MQSAIGVFALTGNYAYTSRLFYTPDDRLFQDGYGLLNAQLGWTATGGRYGVSLFAENLTNKEYTIAQYAQAGIADNYVAGNPRMYGFKLHMKL